MIQFLRNLVNGHFFPPTAVDDFKSWVLTRVLYNCTFKIAESIVRQSALLAAAHVTSAGDLSVWLAQLKPGLQENQADSSLGTADFTGDVPKGQTFLIEFDQLGGNSNSTLYEK